ncbi:TPA: hypothetical protein KAC69_004858, partial [Escherichia coli]|nr:hypothetical protein [Escherichia coli]HBB3002550.1 hypothetical protein [Escherichia coli]HCW2849431.1 hypothetical protein [Escherichia coli]HDL0427372.1 hypothetical protein [Escherichia coli]
MNKAYSIIWSHSRQ